MSAPANHALPVSHKRVIVLGSTGSIGTQTLDVIEHLNTLHEQGKHATRYEVVGLAAGSDHETLFEQAQQWGVGHLAINEAQGIAPTGTGLRTGTNAAVQLIDDIECDLIIGAIVGIAGLASVYRAVSQGIDVALANKESLVAAGDLVTRAAFKSGARLLPLDSEHAGIWQCLAAVNTHHPCPPMHSPDCVSRVVLTASGGAFREQSRAAIEHASMADALNHPNWDMGAKVTIDSATLMNKGLELLEAHWLFGLPADKLGAVIHPQSIVHAMIECADCSVIAQMGMPDMMAPIQHALCDAHRPLGCAPRLDVTQMGSLDFIEIDPERFPAIGLAMDAINAGGDAGAALNAANEHAVHAFINNRLPFGQIDRCVQHVMQQWNTNSIETIDEVLDADRRARALAEDYCSVKGA
ncbi:MAG: 1-deoxy-D-xylulose-5-phosphate reductoisomerase [Phycisphaerales bacterium JB052]